MSFTSKTQAAKAVKTTINEIFLDILNPSNQLTEQKEHNKQVTNAIQAGVYGQPISKPNALLVFSQQFADLFKKTDTTKETIKLWLNKQLETMRSIIKPAIDMRYYTVDNIGQTRFDAKYEEAKVVDEMFSLLMQQLNLGAAVTGFSKTMRKFSNYKQDQALTNDQILYANDLLYANLIKSVLADTGNLSLEKLNQLGLLLSDLHDPDIKNSVKTLFDKVKQQADSVDELKQCQDKLGNLQNNYAFLPQMQTGDSDEAFNQAISGNENWLNESKLLLTQMNELAKKVTDNHAIDQQLEQLKQNIQHCQKQIVIELDTAKQGKSQIDERAEGLLNEVKIQFEAANNITLNNDIGSFAASEKALKIGQEYINKLEFLLQSLTDEGLVLTRASDSLKQQHEFLKQQLTQNLQQAQKRQQEIQNGYTEKLNTKQECLQKIKSYLEKNSTKLKELSEQVPIFNPNEDELKFAASKRNASALLEKIVSFSKEIEKLSGELEGYQDDTDANTARKQLETLKSKLKVKHEAWKDSMDKAENFRISFDEKAQELLLAVSQMIDSSRPKDDAKLDSELYSKYKHTLKTAMYMLDNQSYNSSGLSDATKQKLENLRLDTEIELKRAQDKFVESLRQFIEVWHQKVIQEYEQIRNGENTPPDSPSMDINESKEAEKGINLISDEVIQQELKAAFLGIQKQIDLNQLEQKSNEQLQQLESKLKKILTLPSASIDLTQKLLNELLLLDNEAKEAVAKNKQANQEPWELLQQKITKQIEQTAELAQQQDLLLKEAEQQQKILLEEAKQQPERLIKGKQLIEKNLQGLAKQSSDAVILKQVQKEVSTDQSLLEKLEQMDERLQHPDQLLEIQKLEKEIRECNEQSENLRCRINNLEQAKSNKKTLQDWQKISTYLAEYGEISRKEEKLLKNKGLLTNRLQDLNKLLVELQDINLPKADVLAKIVGFGLFTEQKEVHNFIRAVESGGQYLDLIQKEISRKIKLLQPDSNQALAKISQQLNVLRQEELVEKFNTIAVRLKGLKGVGMHKQADFEPLIKEIMAFGDCVSEQWPLESNTEKMLKEFSGFCDTELKSFKGFVREAIVNNHLLTSPECAVDLIVGNLIIATDELAKKAEKDSLSAKNLALLSKNLLIFSKMFSKSFGAKEDWQFQSKSGQEGLREKNYKPAIEACYAPIKKPTEIEGVQEQEKRGFGML